MNRVNRIISSAMCVASVVTIFTACGGSIPATVQNPMGAYVEADITPPNGGGPAIGLWAHADGSIHYLTAGNKLFYSSDGGESWKEADMSWAGTLDGEITSLSVTKSGSCFLATFLNGQTKLWKVSEGGTVSPVKIAELDHAQEEGLMTSIAQLEALSEDRFFISYLAYAAPPTVGMTEETRTGGSSDSSMRDGDSGDADTSEGENPSTDSVQAASSDGGERAANFSNSLVKKTLLCTDQGQVIKSFDTQQSVISVAVSDHLLFIMDSSNILQAYDIVTGEMFPEYTNKLEIENPFVHIPAADTEGNFYSVTSKGLIRVAPGASLEETILEGSRYGFSSPTRRINALKCMLDGSFLMALTLPDDQGRLYRYRFDENEPAFLEHELTVWSLTDKPSVRTAIIPYQQQNKDIRVNYEVAVTGEETAAVTQDMIRTLNTSLLAGRGPDVLIVDGLDYQAYQQKGLFADLTGKLQAEVYDSLWEPFKDETGFYIAPMRFSFPALFGSGENLAKINSVDDMVREAMNGAGRPKGNEPSTDPLPQEKCPAFSFSSVDSLFDLFYGVSVPAVLDAKAGVNERELRMLLENVKLFLDKYELQDPTLFTAVNEISFTGTSISGASVTVGSEVSQFAFNRAAYGLCELTTLDFMHILASYARSEYETRLLPGGSEGVYHPMIMACVNAQSPMQDQAVLFLQALLGNDVQNYFVGDGLPVTKSGMQETVRSYDRVQEGLAKYNQMVTGSQTEPKPLGIDFGTLTQQFKTPVSINADIRDMIYSEATLYFRDEASLDEAVNAILAYTELYFAEKQ